MFIFLSIFLQKKNLTKLSTKLYSIVNFSWSSVLSNSAFYLQAVIVSFSKNLFISATTNTGTLSLNCTTTARKQLQIVFENCYCLI